MSKNVQMTLLFKQQENCERMMRDIRSMKKKMSDDLESLNYINYTITNCGQKETESSDSSLAQNSGHKTHGAIWLFV